MGGIKPEQPDCKWNKVAVIVCTFDMAKLTSYSGFVHEELLAFPVDEFEIGDKFDVEIVARPASGASILQIDLTALSAAEWQDGQDNR
jgi:hypothetical protein